MVDPDRATLADILNHLGARIVFEKGTNREVLVVPAFVNFNHVHVKAANKDAFWSNEEKRWTPG